MIVEWMLAMTLKDIAWLAGQRQMSSRPGASRRCGPRAAAAPRSS